MSDRTARFRDHWWWREGWGPGTRYLTWHVLVDDQPALQARVRAHQHALGDVVGLRAVPAEWLHLTLSGVGFAPEVTADERRRLADVAVRLLADLAPVTAVVRPAVVHPEGVALPVDAEGLREVRERLRGAAAVALGPDRVADVSPDLWPHVTVAYADGDADAAPAHDALEPLADLEPVVTVMSAVSLLELERDDRVYRWRVLARAPLGG